MGLVGFRLICSVADHVAKPAHSASALNETSPTSTSVQSTNRLVSALLLVKDEAKNAMMNSMLASVFPFSDGPLFSIGTSVGCGKAAV
jgi:hypothetical protein